MSPMLRYLADSNRRTRFCRPLPSHSAKVPLWFATAKVVHIFGLTNLYLCFFAVFGVLSLFCLLFLENLLCVVYAIVGDLCNFCL